MIQLSTIEVLEKRLLKWKVIYFLFLITCLIFILGSWETFGQEYINPDGNELSIHPTFGIIIAGENNNLINTPEHTTTIATDNTGYFTSILFKKPITKEFTLKFQYDYNIIEADFGSFPASRVRNRNSQHYFVIGCSIYLK